MGKTIAMAKTKRKTNSSTTFGFYHALNELDSKSAKKTTSTKSTKKRGKKSPARKARVTAKQRIAPTSKKAERAYFNTCFNSILTLPRFSRLVVVKSSKPRTIELLKKDHKALVEEFHVVHPSFSKEVRAFKNNCKNDGISYVEFRFADNDMVRYTDEYPGDVDIGASLGLGVSGLARYQVRLLLCVFLLVLFMSTCVVHVHSEASRDISSCSSSHLCCYGQRCQWHHHRRRCCRCCRRYRH